MPIVVRLAAVVEIGKDWPGWATLHEKFQGDISLAVAAEFIGEPKLGLIFHERTAQLHARTMQEPADRHGART